MKASMRPFAIAVLLVSGCSAQKVTETTESVEYTRTEATPAIAYETYALYDLDSGARERIAVNGDPAIAPAEPANAVMRAADRPVSTFSIDVDTAAYSTARRALVAGTLPRANTVRTEEFLNYFDYGYPAPAIAAVPFNVYTEVAPAPWDRDRLLMLVGIQGWRARPEQLPPANLVSSSTRRARWTPPTSCRC